MDTKRPILVVGHSGLGSMPKHILDLAKKEQAEIIILDESTAKGPYGKLLDMLDNENNNTLPPGDFPIRPYPVEPLMDESIYGDLTRKEREANIFPIRTEPKYYRNQPCPCGSGKKYKHCCINKS
jgi:hypothetical protein